MIKVLVVEDSAVVREFLLAVFGADPDILVVGAAADGEQAIEMAQRLRPDVITMDVHMPKIDGVEATRRIMQTDPRPIVIVSGSSAFGEVSQAFAALQAGALAALPRPEGLGHEGHERSARELIQTVKAMAEVKLVRRWSQCKFRATPAPAFEPAAGPPVVAIGASTGGPPALHEILAALPADFPAAVLIGVVQGFAEWLAQSCSLQVAIARHAEPLAGGRVYIAPDGHQMSVAVDGNIRLTSCASNTVLCPSVSHLFASVAHVYGHRAVAGLLSGMGRDGADELRLMKDCGAATFAQDKESSVVHGMPGEAIRLGAARYVLPPEGIAPVLVALMMSSGPRSQRGRTP
jgi:two-component system, chemotaxis family, protein-glutamate methylesterase/glutaminase